MADIVITGAARGLGFELAKQHVAAGDRVFALVRDPAAATALHELAEASSGLLTVHAADVTDARSVRDGAASTGAAAIDILYNVAGIAGERMATLENLEWAEFDAIFEVVAKGPLRVIQAFLPRLHKGSKVINLSSQIGASIWPTGGYYAYGAAKAALNRLMRSVAVDLKGSGIVVGLVHPGWVRTDMGGPAADISPEESASGIRALAENWTLDRSGEFYKWNGAPQPW